MSCAVLGRWLKLAEALEIVPEQRQAFIEFARNERGTPEPGLPAPAPPIPSDDTAHRRTEDLPVPVNTAHRPQEGVGGY